MAGKGLHLTQATVVDEASSLLGKVHHGKFQLPSIVAINGVDNQHGAYEGWVDDSKRVAPIGPERVGAVLLFAFSGDGRIPNHVQGQDGDQYSADPEG